MFQSFVKSLQAREENPFAPLRQLVGPYILRRLKTDRAIIADLPEKTEAARYCHLSRTQVRLYGQVVRTMRREMESAADIARRGGVAPGSRSGWSRCAQSSAQASFRHARTHLDAPKDPGVQSATLDA